MGAQYLLDTNIAIYLTKGTLPVKAFQLLRQSYPVEIRLSAISKIELLGFAFPSGSERDEMEALVNTSIIFSINDAIIDKTIELKRQYKMKLPDAVIAATAIVHDFTLVSRNDKDFDKIQGLKYLNPFSV